MPPRLPRADAEQLHDLVAVEVGPDAVDLLLLAQLLDPRLELVHPPGSARALAALRVVQSQRVSSLSISRCGPASRT